MEQAETKSGNGAVALLKALHAGGARICFANPGTTELTLVDALADVPEIRSVLALFEGVCTGAADGYARVSGQTPLTLLHLGPGFGNGIANLHNARRARSGIVTIIGDHASWHLPYDAPLTSDIESLASPVSVAVVRMRDPHAIGADVAQVLEAAAGAPGGPTTLIVPTDIMDAQVDLVAVPASPPARRTVDAALIEKAAEFVTGAQDLILLLGGDALTEQGQRAAAAIVAKVGGRVLMEPYPAIVPLGGDLPSIERQAYFPEDVIRQMGEARVVLAGALKPISYFGYDAYPSQLVPDERLLCLSDPGQAGVAALEALAARLDAVNAAPVAKAQRAPASHASDAPLSPDIIVESLIQQLPDDAIISLEGSTLGGPWLRNAGHARRHQVMTNTGGAIGQGLPCAVGAALAAPAARVVSLQSDGSGHYTVQALWTMAREKLPVTIIIAANHRYGILQTELNRVDAPLEDPVIASLTRLDNPRADWTALAAGYGVEAVRVTTAAEFDAALARGLAHDGPLLIQAELP